MDSNTSTHCRELERLAAAAATMDYSESVSLEQRQPSQEILRPNLQQAQIPSFGGNSPQIISYIDPYISRGHSHIVPVRSFEAHSYTPESLHSLQQISNSRIVMVATNATTNTNVQIPGWPITHLTVNGIHYPSGTLDIIEDPVGNNFAAIQDDIQRDITSNSNDDPNNTANNSEPSLHINEVTQEILEEDTYNVISRGEGTSAEIHTNPEESTKCVNECNITTRENTSETIQNTFKCNQCDEVFLRDLDLKKHLEVHKPPKRSGLSLETKIEIIKRILAGEKKADMADEYNVNRSSIKSIMKKSETYLLCWKKGMFNPDSKRLKGPKREDVEEALYAWYRQAIQNSSPVSGPILCNKASDFAKKLGHSDFKPTHGWLDRFKKRKKIVFGRGSIKRSKEEGTVDENRLHDVDENKLQEWQNTVIPQILFEFNASDIFAVEEIGLFFQASLCEVSMMRNQKCPGGVRANDRLSLVLCSNMNGLEKFPLLVIGRNKQILQERSQKSLPVHYLFDIKAWLTSDSFNAWLLDMDSWLAQQNRKICLLCCSSPVHSNIPKLMSIKVFKTPSFLSPLRYMALDVFKKVYRKLYLEELILNISKQENTDRLIPKIPLLKCLTLLSSTWHCIHESSIVSSFQRAGITKFPVWHGSNSLESSLPINGQGILDKLTSYGYSPKLLFEDYVHFDNNVQICNLMKDDDILAEVKGDYDEHSESGDVTSPEVDPLNPTLSHVEEALGNLRCYIQYQEGAQEMYRVLGHLEFLLHKGFPEKPYILNPS